MVYLIVYQHVPEERCLRLIADLTGGRAPSAGFVHGMLARCAAVLTKVVKLIKTAVTLAAVAGFDETVIRGGPAGCKKKIHPVRLDRDSDRYHLGGRDLGSFTAFGILPSFAGIAVHDRYSCYFHNGWANQGRTSGLPRPRDPRLQGRRRVLAGCHLVHPGAAGFTRADQRLAHRPLPEIPAGVPRHPQAKVLNRSAPRLGPAGILP